MRIKRTWFSALAVVAALAASAPAAAQTQTVTSPNTAIDPFTPSFAGDRFFGVQSPYAAGHVEPHIGLMVNYGRSLAKVVRGDETLGTPLSDTLTLHANGTFSLWDRLAINVDMPFVVLQQGEDTQAGRNLLLAPSGVAVGDLRVGLRGRLYGEYHDPLQIGVGGYLWLPTGPSDSFVSDPSVRGMPQLIVGGRIDNRFIYTAAIGADIRSTRTYVTKERSLGLAYGAGVGVLLLPERTLQLGVEVAGANVLSPEETTLGSNNLELLGGAKLRFADDFEAGLAAGPGLLTGLGTPAFRGLATFAYTPSQDQEVASDRDNDGINDEADACPDVAGVASDDPAKHGCPPPGDKDGDGIADPDDACPDVAGVANEDPLKHGCPEGDKDSDGIVDKLDACPDVKGPATSDPKTSGCPDADGDGIIDKVDACPNVAGPASDDPAKNGCPDTDGDTIIDKLDACPKVAGPVRSNPAETGCPDTDGDKILDKVDACPKEMGLPHKDPTRNGCPIVQLTKTEIRINQRIEFDTGRSTIRPVSNNILDTVAKLMLDHPEILKLEVQGHTDTQGAAGMNKILSNNRAAAVRRALIARKVAANRLVSKGYGQEKPVASNDTEAGMQENRRVQFVILEQKPIEVKTSVLPTTKAPAPAPKK